MRKLFHCPPAQARALLQSLKAVATAEGALPLDGTPRATLSALREHVLRAEVDLDRLESSLPADLEAVLSDREVRTNLVHLAIAIPFVEPRNEPERTAVMRRIAARLGIGGREVVDAEKAARGHYMRIALDTTRGSLAELSGTSFARSLVLYLKGLVHWDADPEIAARVRRFASLPEGTVGRALLAYWRDNEFGLPGEPGSMQSQVFFKHDMHHVLSGYDTTPRGEFAVAGFYTGLGPKDYADFTALLLLQLQVAVQVDPTVPAWRNQFDPEVYFAALERAAGCTTNVADPRWDPWGVVEQPLAEVRRAYGISEEGGMVRGADDRWCGALGPPARRASPDKRSRQRV